MKANYLSFTHLRKTYAMLDYAALSAEAIIEDIKKGVIIEERGMFLGVSSVYPQYIYTYLHRY